MKHLFTIATIVAAIAVTPSALAGEDSSCHFHGSKSAAESTVIGCANQRRDALVKSGKLTASWQTINHEQITLVDGQKGKEAVNLPLLTKASLRWFAQPITVLSAADFEP